MSRRKKWRADGTPVPKGVHRPLPDPTPAELEALEALTDDFPASLRAFRDLCLLGPARRHRIEKALLHRTRTLCLVLHGVHDPHNQAAVIRTSESFGLQQMHVVDVPGVRWRPSERITQAAHRWVDVRVHGDFTAAAAALKHEGKRILAAALTEGAVPLHEVDPTRPTAFVLGSEGEGLPTEVVAACDGAVTIPMYGLTQSLNVSVAAAVVAAFAVEGRRRAWGDPGDLSETERMALRRRFYVRAAGRIPESLAARLATEDAGDVTGDTPAAVATAKVDPPRAGPVIADTPKSPEE